MTYKKSAALSLALCFVLSAVFIALAVILPLGFRQFYMNYLGESAATEKVENVTRIVLITFYACLPFAVAALYSLIRLTYNIFRGKVFIRRNVAYLFAVAFCCFGVFITSAAIGYRYLPIMLISGVLLIVGIMLVVVANVMSAANALREENDLTI